MIKSYPYNDFSTKMTELAFFSPEEQTILTDERYDASDVFSYEILTLLDKNLSGLGEAAEDGEPVALWFKHEERGDAPRNSISRLNSVLFLRDGKLVQSQLSEMSPTHRAAVLETLGAFFLVENLCEVVYSQANFSIFGLLDALHFKTFTLLRGEFDGSAHGACQEQLEALGLDEETPILKLCTTQAGSPRETHDQCLTSAPMGPNNRI